MPLPETFQSRPYEASYEGENSFSQTRKGPLVWEHIHYDVSHLTEEQQAHFHRKARVAMQALEHVCVNWPPFNKEG